MGVVIGILIIAVLVGMVIWNHKNAEAATTGVQFSSAESPQVIAGAIQAAFCGGAKAKAKSMFMGVTVQPLAGSAFMYMTKIGDEGRIEVYSGNGSGAVVTVAATSLYVGLPPKGQFKSGFLAVGASITHGIYKVLGVTPNAARMKRFAQALEGRVAKQIRRSAI